MGAALSGAPSTFYALVAKRPVLEATEAAGTMLMRDETRLSRLLPAALTVHLALSLFWSHVMAAGLPRRRPVLFGSAAGLGIGIFDLLVVGRRWPMIRALPLVPQLADHVVFGVVVASMLRRPAPRDAVRNVD